jgi:hypothetical protein
MLVNQFAQRELESTLNDSNEFSDLFTLYGFFNKTVIVSTIRIIESKIELLGYSKTLVSRVKLITIELLDNILKHQAIDPTYKPYFEVSINKKELFFKTGNCVNGDDYHTLNLKLKKYIKMTPFEIQKKYMSRLKDGCIDEKGNAGLGLLAIMKKTDQNYHYQLKKINENEYYFENSIHLINLN